MSEWVDISVGDKTKNKQIAKFRKRRRNLLLNKQDFQQNRAWWNTFYSPSSQVSMTTKIIPNHVLDAKPNQNKQFLSLRHEKCEIQRSHKRGKHISLLLCRVLDDGDLRRGAGGKRWTLMHITTQWLRRMWFKQFIVCLILLTNFLFIFARSLFYLRRFMSEFDLYFLCFVRFVGLSCFHHLWQHWTLAAHLENN